jgi:hypothetical protein
VQNLKHWLIGFVVNKDADRLRAAGRVGRLGVEAKWLKAPLDFAIRGRLERFAIVRFGIEDNCFHDS